MGDKTAIEWTDATINPVLGCRRVSEGCRGCYAERLAATRLIKTPRYKGLSAMGANGPRWNGDVRFVVEDLRKVLAWKRPRKIFVCDMSDLFYEKVPDKWIDAVFGVMAACPQHTFQILTKRPERMRVWFKELAVKPISGLVESAERTLHGKIGDAWKGASWPLENVWLGTSVENQEAAYERIPYLIATPAVVKFLSCEPLIGPVDLDPYMCEDHGEESVVYDRDREPFCNECAANGHDGELTSGHWLNPLNGGISWVIAGGESGPTARPSHPDWFKSIRDQCVVNDVPFFFKQWGSWQNGSAPQSPTKNRIVLNDGSVFSHPDDATHEQRSRWPDFRPCAMANVGKKAAGRDLDGRIHDDFPEVEE